MTTPTRPLTDDDPITQREAVALLADIARAKRELREWRRLERSLRDAIAAYLEQAGERELADGERGIVARLQERSRPDTYDLPRLPDDVVARLAKIPGLLTVNAAALRGLGDSSMDLHDLRRVKMPGGITTALVVERKRI